MQGGRAITDPKYASAKTSGLKFTVQPGKNEFNIPLTSPPKSPARPGLKAADAVRIEIGTKAICAIHCRRRVGLQSFRGPIHESTFAVPDRGRFCAATTGPREAIQRWPKIRLNACSLSARLTCFERQRSRTGEPDRRYGTNRLVGQSNVVLPPSTYEPSSVLRILTFYGEILEKIPFCDTHALRRSMADRNASRNSEPRTLNPVRSPSQYAPSFATRQPTRHRDLSSETQLRRRKMLEYCNRKSTFTADAKRATKSHAPSNSFSVMKAAALSSIGSARCCTRRYACSRRPIRRRHEDQSDQGLHALHAVVPNAGEPRVAPAAIAGASTGRWPTRIRTIVDASGKRQIASHYYPMIGPYDSTDPNVLEYHMLLHEVFGRRWIDGRLVRPAGTNGDINSLLTASNAIVNKTNNFGLGVGVVLEDNFASNTCKLAARRWRT